MFLEVMYTNGADKTIKDFLYKINKGPNYSVEVKAVKTLILMDSTGSMSSLINNCKNSIKVMFDNMTKILTENGLSEGFVSIQLACYRSYNS